MLFHKVNYESKLWRGFFIDVYNLRYVYKIIFIFLELTLTINTLS